MRFCIRVTAVLLLLGLIPLALGAEEADGPLFLWRTEIGEAEVFLLGSIHILSEDFYPLPASVRNAVEQADNLVLEAIVDGSDQEGLTDLVMQYGLYRDGSNLENHLSPDLFKRTLQALEGFGIPADRGVMMRPWLLATTLEALALSELGLDAYQGMEVVLSESFSEDHILELEGAAFQLQLLLNMSDDEQALFLESVLDEASDQAQVLNDIFEAWSNGDEAAMAGLLEASGEAEQKLMDRLLNDRNAGMVETLLEMVSGSDETWLVLVGTGHFIGERGIPALLEQVGLAVEQISRSGSLLPVGD